VGKHAAAKGASADPIVAAALASRHDHSGGVHSAEVAGESPVGWPAPPRPGGGGLGWPADAVVDAAEVHAAEVHAAAELAEPALRGGWRRFFGTRRVA
jgi:hypothetical protein